MKSAVENILKKIDYVKALGIPNAQNIIKKIPRYSKLDNDFDDEEGPNGIYELSPKKLPDSKRINAIIANIFINVLDDWTDTSDNESAKYFVILTPYINQLKKKYPETFKLDTSKYQKAYRGTRLSTDKLRLFIKKTSKNEKNWVRAKIGSGTPYMVYVERQFPYKSHRPVQSWSVKPEVATGFDDQTVLITKTNNDDFLFNPEFMNKNMKEFEVLHRGNNLKTYLAVDLETFNELKAHTSKNLPHISTLSFKKEEISL